MANIHRICEEMGIKLCIKKNEHPAKGTLLPYRTTWSKQSIRIIAETGEEMGNSELIYDALGLMIGNRDNAHCLFGDCISGVGRWMVKHKVTTSEVSFLKEPFNEKVKLYPILQTIKHHKIDQRPVQVALLISSAMEPHLKELR